MERAVQWVYVVLVVGSVLVPTVAWGRSAAPGARAGMAAGESKAERLVGRPVRIETSDGKVLFGTLSSVTPLRVVLEGPDGTTEIIVRARIRRIRAIARSEIPSKLVPKKGVPGALVAKVGMGLTLVGIGLELLVAVPLMVAGSRADCPSDSLCLTSESIAAYLLGSYIAPPIAAVGIPMWVAAAVHGAVRTGSHEARLRKQRLYERWGMGLTFGGLGVAAVGGVFLTIWATASPTTNGLAYAFIGCLSAIASGVFVTLFIGVPMWAEAARAPKVVADAPRSPFPDPVAPRPKLALDPVYEERQRRRLFYRPLPAVFLSYGWRF